MPNGTTQEDFQSWLLRVAETGLQARWDAEYLERFKPAQQAQPLGVGAAAMIVPQQPAPVLSPAVMIGGGLAVAAALYFLLRD